MCMLLQQKDKKRCNTYKYHSTYPFSAYNVTTYMHKIGQNSCQTQTQSYCYFQIVSMKVHLSSATFENDVWQSLIPLIIMTNLSFPHRTSAGISAYMTQYNNFNRQCIFRYRGRVVQWLSVRLACGRLVVRSPAASSKRR